ncbi:MAG TPA: hypothetical protein VGE37_03545 [Archangium sp.]
MVNLQSEDLLIEVDERDPKVLVLNWLGRSASRSPGSVLHPWFEQLFALAKGRGAGVEMRFEKLQHFNSSTIAVLIQLINSAQDQQLHLTVRYDATLRWQTLSFDALKRALRPFDSGEARVQFVGQ